MAGHVRGIQLDAGGLGRHATSCRAFISVHAATDDGTGNRVS